MIELEGLHFISMTEAAIIAGMSNDRFGRILMGHLVPNGLRIFNTAKNNKGIQICKEDVELVVKTSINCRIRLIDVMLT